MNTKDLSLSVGIIALAVGLVIGASVAYAATTTFKVKENKIFFNLVTDPEADGEEVTLPSVIGKTGHVYIYKGTEVNNGTFLDINIYPVPGETINGVQSNVVLNSSNQSIILIGDEANNAWWALSNGVN